MPGAQGTIEILRDQHGLPHVFATNEPDALFGQGVIHAQDRLFQMDSMRRLASGRLAEVGGPATLESDRFMRRVGLAHRARRDIDLAAPGDVELLNAYAAGVNAGITSLPALPPEYGLIGSNPEPWLPEHTTLIARLVMFSFAVNWDTELLRERLLRSSRPCPCRIPRPRLRRRTCHAHRRALPRQR